MRLHPLCELRQETEKKKAEVDVLGNVLRVKGSVHPRYGGRWNLLLTAMENF